MSSQKPLVLVSQNEKDIAFAQDVAKFADTDLLQPATLNDAIELMKTRVDDKLVYLIDASTQKSYQQIENIIQEKLGLFSDEIAPNRMIFITDEIELAKSKYLAISPIFGSLITRNYGDHAFSAKQFSYLINSCGLPRIFGLKNLLGAEAKIQLVKFQRTTQKQEAAEAVKNYAIAAQFKARTASLISNAVDELLMNAMFDAAISEDGKQLHSKLSRETEIPLEGKSQVELYIGFDGIYLGVTVVDQFGSLDKERLLEHLSKDYSDEEYKIKNNTASAGLGLATVFNSGGNLVFTSERGKRTEVSVLFRKTDSVKEFKTGFRFLSTHFYE